MIPGSRLKSFTTGELVTILEALDSVEGDPTVTEASLSSEVNAELIDRQNPFLES